MADEKEEKTHHSKTYPACERCGEPCGGNQVCGTCLAIEAEAKELADAAEAV